MYLVVARSGALKGAAWPVTEHGLVFGRGRGCDIVVSDPVISRKHCEIKLTEAGAQIIDLGSSNLTLVNGEPVHERTLRPGDEIGIGPSLFLMVRAPSMRPVSDPSVDDDSTRIFLGEPVTPRSQSLPAMGRLHTIHDYTELFRTCRRMSRAGNVAELLESLRQDLAEHFRPEAVWIARFHADNEDRPALFPPPDLGEDETRRPPMELIRQAFSSQKPLAQGPTGRTGGRGPSVLAAPMTVGAERLGVLALRSELPTLAQDEGRLEFLAALAHQIAPLFHVVAEMESLRRDNERLRARAGESAVLIGESKGLRAVRSLVRESARTNLSVLILGETGTGKELVARSIHDQSRRARGPFVAVNCAAIPSQLFESELFGHEKGAFTDASYTKIGLMEQAHGGTLFLDEIGDLSLESQARILRSIEQGTFRRVGAQKETHVDIRVVSATNEDIRAAIQSGEFRADLFHRLNGFLIEIPPLRERPSDIPVLAEHFLELGRGQAKHPIKGFHPDALAYLQSRKWPGNVRELRNCIERAIALADHEVIVVDDLHLPGAALSTDPRELGPKTLAEMEKEHIARILREHAGNVSAAARTLEIHRNTLYNKIAQYGIEV